MAYKMPNLLDTGHIGRICLVIRIQNKAEDSTCSVKSSINRFVGGPQKILLNVNCGVKVVIICM